MKPVFDENGLAAEPGEIRCFYYDSVTGEYTGWSDEYINIGVSMPGYSTDIDPGDSVEGNVLIFTDGVWKQEEDHRGDIVYSTENGEASTVDYIGLIKDGYTSVAPSTPYDKWSGKKWVTNTDAKHVADVEAANQQKTALLDEAQETIRLWQTELQLGIISDEDKASLTDWVNYIKEIKAVDTSTAPDIVWPTTPGL